MNLGVDEYTQGKVDYPTSVWNVLLTCDAEQNVRYSQSYNQPLLVTRGNIQHCHDLFSLYGSRITSNSQFATPKIKNGYQLRDSYDTQ